MCEGVSVRRYIRKRSIRFNATPLAKAANSELPGSNPVHSVKLLTLMSTARIISTGCILVPSKYPQGQYTSESTYVKSNVDGRGQNGRLAKRQDESPSGNEIQETLASWCADLAKNQRIQCSVKAIRRSLCVDPGGVECERVVNALAEDCVVGVGCLAVAAAGNHVIAGVPFDEVHTRTAQQGIG